MEEVTVAPLPNGPYIVTGLIKLLDDNGKELPVAQGKIALCRCGGSGNKPFCDGTHAKIGFRDLPEAA